MMEFIFILHMILCIVIGVLLQRRILCCSWYLLVFVFILPVIGMLLLVVDLYERRSNRIGIHYYEGEKFKTTDIKYKRIRVDVNEGKGTPVPLEEAILIDDAATKRNLLFYILQSNPGKYVELLLRARLEPDTELSHYATTAMMEIQSRYERQISDLEKKMAMQPGNLVYKGRYQILLTEYIQSGLLSGTVLKIYRLKLDAILGEFVRKEGASKNQLIAYINNKIDMKENEDVLSLLKRIKTYGQIDEQTCQLFVKYYWSIKDGNGIRAVLDEIKEKQIYLSGNGKKWFYFWSGLESVQYEK